MLTIPSPRFYVYVLSRPDSRPFYVGKGQGSRVFDHDAEARSGHHCHKCSVIRKIWRSGGEIQRYILLETDNEQEALEYEVAIIALYGRENLTNLTDGGQGVSGLIATPATRRKLSAASTKMWADPEIRAKILASLRPAVSTPEYRLVKQALSRVMWQRSEYRTKHRQIMLEVMTRPEYRARIAASSKARWEDPVYREKRNASLKATLATPEGKARHGAATSASWNDPNSRPKRLAAIRAFANSPEGRANRAAAMLGKTHTAEARAAISAGRSAWIAVPENLEKHRQSVIASNTPEVMARRKATFARPEVKAKKSASIAASWQDPEIRAKRSAAIQASWDRRRAAALQLPLLTDE